MQGQAEDNRDVVNIGRLERLACGVLGGSMAVAGLARFSARGLLLAGGGMLLVYRAATGRSRLYRGLHISGSIKGRRPEAPIPYQTGIKVEGVVTVSRPPQELYEFWKNPENLLLFMDHLKSVTSTGNGRAHWVTEGPLGTDIQWDSEIINDRPGELIGWQSIPGSQVANAGSVNFTPVDHGRRTKVKLVLEYKPVGGPLGAAINVLAGKNPKHQIERDLRRFKNLMEAGVAERLYGSHSRQEA